CGERIEEGKYLECYLPLTALFPTALPLTEGDNLAYSPIRSVDSAVKELKKGKYLECYLPLTALFPTAFPLTEGVPCIFNHTVCRVSKALYRLGYDKGSETPLYTKILSDRFAKH